MLIVDKKKFAIFCSILAIVVGIFGLLGYYFWNMQTNSLILENDLKNLAKAGEEAVKDLKKMPAMQIEKQDDKYVLTDETSDGISITYNKEGENQLTENNGQDKPKFQIDFPADYQKPIEVKLDAERVVTIVDNSKDKAKAKLLFGQETITKKQDANNPLASGQEKQTDEQKKYLSYETNRKKIIYAYQKDQATGEKKLKNWIVYENGSGQEQESYTLQNAKIKKNSAGEVEVFYFGQKEMQSQQAAAEVAPSLLERAQKTLQKEMGEDILNSGTPDFVIPKSYFLDKDGNRTDLEWNVDEQTGTISLEIKNQNKNLYPLALDPTLSFTAPGQSNSGHVITGEASSRFGYAMATGDFNADGKVDLAVGAYGYSSNAGRAYIFYGGSIITENVTGADVTITGEASSAFGFSMTVGDFNADGKTDLAVGAYGYFEGANKGRAYIFYNGSIITENASDADVIITGQAFNNYFGTSMTAGDFNADGKTDLAVGAPGYSSNNGRAYIFYNGSIITENASDADVIITGVSSGAFGSKMISGDINADGKADLIVGENRAGRVSKVYVFYNGAITTKNASSADAVMTGSTSGFLGGIISLSVGDFNADGKIDLAVGEDIWGGSGNVFIFYNGSITTENFSDADVTIASESSSDFGASMTSGDFNTDGKTDLAIGASNSVCIFYNDGSIPTTAATADVIITGETSSFFGYSMMTSGDFNTDGKTDLAIGAYGYSSNAGRTYIFYSQNGQVNTNLAITGETSSAFGTSMVSGDFNADGKIDLAVGAPYYSSQTGSVYIFYNGAIINEVASGADVIITGEASDNYFGNSMNSADFNADGKVDLAVGAFMYSSETGRTYIFYNGSIITENAIGADVIITGEASSQFSSSMTSGDFNADGKIDLAVGASAYSSSAGRAYIFYNGSIITENATDADVIISGEASSLFGRTMTSGDFNADGKTDLAVGANLYSSGTGRTHIFYNGAIANENASGADVIITGEASSGFGYSMTSGDFNADGKNDLAVAAFNYDVGSNTNEGRAYIFYNGSIITENASDADVIITGEASSYFGSSMTSGDFNTDGKADLTVGSDTYSSQNGRAYIFYNDGLIPTTAVTADIIITGESGSKFGSSMASGDFNSDGRIDLSIGAYAYSTDTGQIYIYETRENYAWQLQPQKTIRTNPISGQEMKITGEAGSYFGNSMISGDFNADGKTDLAVGAYAASSYAGRAYIFYNDGSIPATATIGADVIITGEASSRFGFSITAGDFNADGKTDLAVGAYIYSGGAGRAYIFYNGSIITENATGADVIITGETSSNYFGSSMTVGDFNADGKTDLAVGAPDYSSNAGRTYIFYNGAIITENASGADAIITGEASNNFFGKSLTVGDFNADGKTDLAVGAYGYSSYAGRAYIFYNGSIITENASAADVIITGEASSAFGVSMTSGDFNADGKTDLAVGAYAYSSSAGRVYIFNNGSITTKDATGANTIITGESSSGFGYAMTAGDFNADGKTDLVVGANLASSFAGRAYIFYNGSIITENATGADVIITGEALSNFGYSMNAGDFNADGKIDLVVGGYGYDAGTNTNEGRVYFYTFNDPVLTGDASSNLGISMISGDFNADGKTDLAVGAYTYSSASGRVYIFYNDGSIPTAAASGADVIITGESSSNFFGNSLTAGDFNADGKIDLAVGAYGYSSAAGRAYIFYNDGSIPTMAATADVIITGESNSCLGYSMTSGDFNADGKTDLAVGAYGYSSSAGRAYIFYNDGSIPTTAATADVIITGEASSYFGVSMTAGDFNADGKTDLAVGAHAYSSFTGRAYIFYNDGSIPTSAASGADVIITGESSSNFFGNSLTAGDFNADGKIDLAVGAYTNSSNAGRVYIFNNGSITTKDATGANTIITGESSSGFGYSMTAGDFNADGKTDLVVGAPGYSSNTGRIYVFYGTASFPSSAASANLTFTGETTNNVFGYSVSAGDFNADGKIDLAIGAYGYSSSAGRFYVYSMESKTGPLSKIKTRGTSKYRGTVKIK